MHIRDQAHYGNGVIMREIDQYLHEIGAKSNGKYRVLDQISSELFIVFDTRNCPEHPEKDGTAHVILMRPGQFPSECYDKGVLVLEHASRQRLAS